jgi:hypothetical protein
VPAALAEAGDYESCGSCGASLDTAQEYCLECGARVQRPSGAIHALGSAWRRRLPWYPGDWIWPSLGAAVLAALGATGAILATTGSHGRGIETIVATTSIPPAPATTAPLQATLPTVPGTPPPATKVPLSSILTRWPDGNGYTIVLESLPATRGLAAAQAKAQAAAGKGLRQVGILDSSRYASLHPGYYVIFSGVYGSLEDAQTALQTVSSRFPAAYARQISP